MDSRRISSTVFSEVISLLPQVILGEPTRVLRYDVNRDLRHSGGSSCADKALLAKYTVRAAISLSVPLYHIGSLCANGESSTGMM
jgi:hypothetical protein